MAHKNLKIRLTCFLCRYEITKHNKCEKQIKFKGKLKPICKYCNKNNHKILDKKYKNIDIQCKICDKPSRYKNCIKCSICDHLFHGKCLELSKKDIKKIETVCDFFMCIKCNDNTIPKQLDNDNQKITSRNAKSNQKQRLTCNNIVPKQIYPKNIYYIMKICIVCVKNVANLD